MLTFSASQRIYLAVEPVDMRKQFNGLWALAAEKLREDPFSGAVRVHEQGSRRVKILCWDGTGVWVAAKRLEKGRFSWPALNGSAKVNLEPAASTMLLAGIDLKDGCKKRGMSVNRIYVIDTHDVVAPPPLHRCPPRKNSTRRTLTLKAELANLEAQVAWFQRQMFGARSEKQPLDVPAQSKLGLAETPQQERIRQTGTYERRTPAPEKRPIPAEVFAKLPVTETLEIVPDEVKAAPEAFEQISEERTFEVDLIRPKLVKREIVRPKFRRKADRDQAPVIAPALPRVAAGGYASAGLIAYIVISKYQHHLPLYRLESMSAQWGAELSRKTMADWVRIAADWAEPIYKLMHAKSCAGSTSSATRRRSSLSIRTRKAALRCRAIFGS